MAKGVICDRCGAAARVTPIAGDNNYKSPNGWGCLQDAGGSEPVDFCPNCDIGLKKLIKDYVTQGRRGSSNETN